MPSARYRAEGTTHSWTARADTPADRVISRQRTSMPRVNGSKVWLNYQVSWVMPEQELAPSVPTQPPLSR